MRIYAHGKAAGPLGSQSLDHAEGYAYSHRLIDGHHPSGNRPIWRSLKQALPDQTVLRMNQDDKQDALRAAVDRNISALLEQSREDARQESTQDRIAGRITDFAGSMRFVYLHLVLFGGWIVINLGWVPIIPAWDPTMVVLAMLASVEAIFISTFVLITQNRMAEADSRRADLNLQISLLSEHETTRLIALVSKIAERLDVRSEVDEEIEDLKRDIDPQALLTEIENRKNGGV